MCWIYTKNTDPWPNLNYRYSPGHCLLAILGPTSMDTLTLTPLIVGHKHFIIFTVCLSVWYYFRNWEFFQEKASKYSD